MCPSALKYIDFFKAITLNLPLPLPFAIEQIERG